MKVLTFLTAVILLSAPFVSADQVTLKNGDRLTGSIVKLDDKKLVLKTDFADTVNIKWDAVSAISAEQPITIQTTDRQIAATHLTQKDGSLEISSASGQPVTVAAADIKGLRSESEQAAYEKSLHPGLLAGWAGGANLGLALARGNSQSLNVSTGVNLARTTTTDKLALYSTTVYTKDDILNSITADAIQGGVRYDHNLTKKLFAYVSGDFEHDELQQLDIRAILSGGLGWHAINGPRAVLDILGGASWTHESYGTGLVNNIFSPSAGEDLTVKLSSNTVFKETVFFFPYLSSGLAGNYRVAFDSGLNTKISKWLAWQTTLSDHYVTNPLPGTKGNDLLLSTGLGITLSGKK